MQKPSKLLLKILVTIILFSMPGGCKKQHNREKIEPEDIKNDSLNLTQELAELHLSSSSVPNDKIIQIKLCEPEEICQELSLSSSQIQIIFHLPEFFSVRVCPKDTMKCESWQYSIIKPPLNLDSIRNVEAKQSITTTAIALNDLHGFSMIKFGEGGRILVRYTLLKQAIDQVPETALELARTGLRNSGNLCFLNSSLQFWYSDSSFRQQILDADLTNHKFIKSTDDITIKSARQMVVISLQTIFSEWNKEFPNLDKIEKNKILFQQAFDVAILDKSIFPMNPNEQVQSHISRMLRSLEDQGADPYFTTYGNQKQKSGKDLVEVFFSDYLGFSGNNQGRGVRIGSEYSMGFDGSVKAYSDLFSVSTVILQTHGKNEKMQDIVYRQFDSFTTGSLNQLNEGMSEYHQNQDDFFSKGGCNAIGSCFQRSVIYSEGLNDITFNAPEKLKSPDGQTYLQRSIEVAPDLDIPYMDSSKGDARYSQKMELTSVMIRDWDDVKFGHWYSFVKEGGKWYEYNDMTAKEVNWSYVKSKSEKYGMVFKYNKKSGSAPMPFINSQRPYQVLTKTNSYMDFDSNKSRYLALNESTGRYTVASGTGDHLKRYDFNEISGQYENIADKQATRTPAKATTQTPNAISEASNQNSHKKNLQEQPVKNNSGIYGAIKMGSLVFIAIGGIVGMSKLNNRKNQKQKDE